VIGTVLAGDLAQQINKLYSALQLRDSTGLSPVSPVMSLHPGIRRLTVKNLVRLYQKLAENEL